MNGPWGTDNIKDCLMKVMTRDEMNYPIPGWFNGTIGQIFYS